MPREMLMSDGGGTLSQADINLQTAQEVSRAATTTINNALANAGYPIPAVVPSTAPTSISSGSYLSATPADPLKDKAVKPSAPTGYHYTWIGGTTTGSWVLYKDAVVATPTGGGGGGNLVVTPTTTTTTTPLSTTPVSTGPTLASNTFKSTLAIFFGQAEMSKPWVDELYKLTAPYYKSGSSVDEALNLALQEGRNNANLKEFTARFKGIFDLQDKLVAGQAVTVPTIAEFVATEAKMGDVLNQAGLGSINNQQFLGDIIGKGVNAVEFANRINNVFLRIDQMPQQAKDFISSTFPTLDKAQLAKTILTGDKGAVQLSKELGGMEVQAAAKAQGLNESVAGGLDIAARGFGYQEALTGFGQVAQGLPTTQKLLEMRTGGPVAASDAQALLEQNVFYKNAAEQERLRKIAEEEANRFAAKPGSIGSRAFASQQRGAGLI